MHDRVTKPEPCCFCSSRVSAGLLVDPERDTATPICDACRALIFDNPVAVARYAFGTWPQWAKCLAATAVAADGWLRARVRS